MPSPHVINITSGKGSSRILNGTYTVTADVAGYNNAPVDPASQVISSSTGIYDFTVAATGTLTLRVTEDGTSGASINGRPLPWVITNITMPFKPRP